MASFLGINFGKKKVELSQPLITNNEKIKNYNFTSPFCEVGGGNLALPYINISHKNAGYVRYGSDNLYPNLLRQLYHTSPLHSSIVNFIINASVGGGYEIKLNNDNAVNKIDLFKFENNLDLPKFIKRITKDALVFGAVNIVIKNDSKGRAISAKRIPMDELRWDEEAEKFFYNKDFSVTTQAKRTFDKYQIGLPNHEGILTIRFDDGDSVYPIPSYATANNWIFLDGEASYLHKSNILNSIFPSMVIKFPKKPASDEEFQQYKTTINQAKGAAEAGKTLTFFENGVEQLPIIETIQTSNNDKLFLQTDERTDSKICQAWGVNPHLMGILVPGKLGSGSDIKQSYVIFEKNVIGPLRREIEEIINSLMLIFMISGEFTINNYQIIGDEIVEIKNNETKQIIK